MAAPLTPEQLGVTLFSNEPGSMGVMLTESDDNEYIFELMLSILRSGLMVTGRSYESLVGEEGSDFVNSRLVYMGYKIMVERDTPENIRKLTPYCTMSQPSDVPVLSKFHPYVLMKHMSPVPESYNDYHTEKEYLHQVIAVINGDIILRFYPVNIVQQSTHTS